MGQWDSERIETTVGAPRRTGWLARTGLGWIAACATAAAALLAGILTLVFAATLAVVVVLAGSLFALYALAVRARRGRRDGPVLLEARRVGHSWVAYGWDQRSR
jgi:hypothetical protein